MVAVLMTLLGAGVPAVAASYGSDLRKEAQAAAKSINKTRLTEASERVAAAAKQRRAVGAAARSVCYEVHVQNIGWQGVRCDGQVAGTTGQNRQVEAIAIAVSSDVGAVCYQAHLQNIGWQAVRCDGQVAGTIGQNRQMEAIAIDVAVGSICYQAHVQNIGWQGVRCDGQVAGTTGQNRQIEAIAISV
ncbi:hypothetical protein ACGFI4_31155 [Micromonospora carbonacea]|uniref:hypothetical protein n=1 Tax=Micromonospora carbonacea TaxID=47853 RepID=UPI003714ABD0